MWFTWSHLSFKKISPATERRIDWEWSEVRETGNLRGAVRRLWWQSELETEVIWWRWRWIWTAIERIRSCLGHGSMELNELHVMVERENGGLEWDPGFWLMNWVDGRFMDQGHSGRGAPSCIAWFCIESQRTERQLEGERELQSLGRGRKGNNNERKKRQCPLPESIPGHKNTQTYYDYSF